MPIIPALSDAFATPGDLATLLQRTFTVDEQAAALLVLDIATETIRTFTHQTLSRVDDDELVDWAQWSNDLWLPERPVIDLTSITIDGVAVDPASYTWTQDGRIVFDFAARRLTYRARATIVYSHGFVPMRADIKGICLEMARAAVVLPDGAAVTQEQIGNYSVTFRPEAAAVLTTSQEKRLKPYRPPVIGVAIVAGAWS